MSLDKDLYFHGEKVIVSLQITNHSKKSVRTVKVSIVQHTEVTLVNAHYGKNVAAIETQEGCPISPGASYTKQFEMHPVASSNRDKRGIALDGMLKETDTNLASSTLIDPQDAIGIIISYVARVKLFIGPMGGEIQADVPFKLATPEVSRLANNCVIFCRLILYGYHVCFSDSARPKRIAIRLKSRRSP